MKRNSPVIKCYFLKIHLPIVIKHRKKDIFVGRRGVDVPPKKPCLELYGTEGQGRILVVIFRAGIPKEEEKMNCISFKNLKRTPDD